LQKNIERDLAAEFFGISKFAFVMCWILGYCKIYNSNSGDGIENNEGNLIFLVYQDKYLIRIFIKYLYSFILFW
jgi:hypothetical protein